MSAYSDYLKTLGTWSGTREEWNESLFNAGMTTAAEICEKIAKEQNDEDNDRYGVGGQIVVAILAARDGI